MPAIFRSRWTAMAIALGLVSMGCRKETDVALSAAPEAGRVGPIRLGDTVDLYQGQILDSVYGVDANMFRRFGGRLLQVVVPHQSQRPVEFVFGADSSASIRSLEVLDSLLDSLSVGRKSLLVRDSTGRCGIHLDETEGAKIWDSSGFFKASPPSPDDFGANPIRWKLPRVERDLGDPGEDLYYLCTGVVRISGRLMYSYQLRDVCREAQEIETNPICIQDEFLVDAVDGFTWGWGGEGKREFVIRRGGDGVRILKASATDSSRLGAVVESGCHDQSFLWRYGKDGEWLEGISLATGKVFRRIPLAPTTSEGRLLKMGGDLEGDSTKVVYALELAGHSMNVYRTEGGNRFVEVSRNWPIPEGGPERVRFVGPKDAPELRTGFHDHPLDGVGDWERLDSLPRP